MVRSILKKFKRVILIVKFLDKNIKRKTEIVSNTLHYVKNSKIPLPSLVEISDSEPVIDLAFLPK